VLEDEIPHQNAGIRQALRDYGMSTLLNRDTRTAHHALVKQQFSQSKGDVLSAWALSAIDRLAESTVEFIGAELSVETVFQYFACNNYFAHYVSLIA
jgi:hypothetical protein